MVGKDSRQVDFILYDGGEALGECVNSILREDLGKNQVIHVAYLDASELTGEWPKVDSFLFFNLKMG